MNRRQFLGAVGGLGGLGGPLGGCLGEGAVPSQSTESPTPSPIIEAPPCPEKPDPLTPETATQYAKEIEKHYAKWALQQEKSDIESISVQFQKTEVTEVESGLVVYLWVWLSYKQDSAFADEFYVASYYITNEIIRRAKSPKKKKINPRTNGAPLRC